MTNRTAKRDKVLGARGRSGTKNGPRWIFPALFGVLVIVLAAAGLRLAPSRPVEQRVEQTPLEASQSQGVIAVALSEVKSKRLVGFTYHGPNGKLPLLAYLAPSGRIITAVSICEPCNSTTFHIEGNELVCNSCGTRWDLENLRGISGGCQNYPPDRFPNSLSGDRVVIREASVASWKPRV